MKILANYSLAGKKTKEKYTTGEPVALVYSTDIVIHSLNCYFN